MESEKIHRGPRKTRPAAEPNFGANAIARGSARLIASRFRARRISVLTLSLHCFGLARISVLMLTLGVYWWLVKVRRRSLDSDASSQRQFTAAGLRLRHVL